MNIKETIAIINQMQLDGVIGSYAIGGAVAATFYLEPTSTEDVDVFVTMQVPSGQTLITLAPIYEYLKARGCKVDGQYVVIADWPVQFLPPDSPLVEEALQKAVERNVDGLSVRVFAAEHLIAIALKLGRPKDKLRLAQFLEASSSLEPQRKFDESVLQEILERYDLNDRWNQFKRQ